MDSKECFASQSVDRSLQEIRISNVTSNIHWPFKGRNAALTVQGAFSYEYAYDANLLRQQKLTVQINGIKARHTPDPRRTDSLSPVDSRRPQASTSRS